MVQTNPRPAGATEAKIPVVKPKKVVTVGKGNEPIVDATIMPQGALPALGIFVANCLKCNRDTLFARVVDRGVLRWFCSNCGSYVIPG